MIASSNETVVYMNVKQLAKRWFVSATYIYRRIADGTLPVSRPTGKALFRVDMIEMRERKAMIPATTSAPRVFAL